MDSYHRFRQLGLLSPKKGGGHEKRRYGEEKKKQTMFTSPLLSNENETIKNIYIKIYIKIYCFECRIFSVYSETVFIAFSSVSVQMFVSYWMIFKKRPWNKDHGTISAIRQNPRAAYCTAVISVVVLSWWKLDWQV